MKYTPVIILLLLCLRPAANAQYNFFHVFLEHGLSDARVNAIVQDRYGFMWFATPKGLNRYDSYVMKSFYADPSGEGLPSNNITSLFSDSRGNLWIGTAAGLVRFDFRTARFVSPDTLQAPGKAAAQDYIACFEEDSAGNLYVGGRKALYRQNKDGRWEDLSRQSGLGERLSAVRGLKLHDSHHLFITTRYKGFYMMDPARGRIDSIPGEKRLMMGMESINRDEILIGELFSGALKYHIPTRRFSKAPGLPGGRDSIHFNSVHEILKDREGRIWLASAYHRLAQYLPEEDRITTFTPQPFGRYNFEGLTAYCVYEDQQGNIWVGTTARGVYLFNPNHNRVKHYPQNDYVPGAIPSGQVTCLAFLDSLTILAGTERGASFYDTRSARAVTYKGSSGFNTSGPPDQVQSGLRDRKGIIWLGSARLGLARFDPRSKQWMRFTKSDKRSKPLPEDTFTDMLELPDGNLLLLNLNRIALFDTRSFDCYSQRTDPASPLFQLTNISDLCTDSSGAIWLSSYSGQLYRYHPARKVLEDHSARLHAVAERLVLHKIAAGAGDEIWCASNKGLVKTAAGKPAALYTINTPDNALREVRGVLPMAGDIWFCNNRSVGRLHVADGKMTMLGEKDGLKDVQLFSNTLTPSPYGSILVGGHTGFYEVFPDSMQAQLPPPVPQLTSFNVYDQPYAGNQTVSALDKIRLKHTENFFSFDISAFDYIGAEDIEYAYMLEGFDKEWQYTQQQRSGAYTNVPGGHYRLLLKARNSYSDWSSNGQVIDIYVASPYWKKWWFFLLAGLLIASTLYAIYRFRINAIRKESRLHSAYETKLNELENSVLRTQMNPHFIFNSLNTINSYILLNNTAEANQYISRFSRLMRLILEHSRARQILLADELEALKRYIELESIRFDNKFGYQIIIDEGIDPAVVEIPPLIIQPFVENAILHGLLPLSGTGMLTITVKKSGDVLWCVVADNGIGRERSKARKHRNMGNQKSHGMEITIKRIELFNRSHQVMEKVRIIDVNDNGATGTIVEIPVVWQETF